MKASSGGSVIAPCGAITSLSQLVFSNPSHTGNLRGYSVFTPITDSIFQEAADKQKQYKVAQHSSKTTSISVPTHRGASERTFSSAFVSRGRIVPKQPHKHTWPHPPPSPSGWQDPSFGLQLALFFSFVRCAGSPCVETQHTHPHHTTPHTACPFIENPSQVYGCRSPDTCLGVGIGCEPADGPWRRSPSSQAWHWWRASLTSTWRRWAPYSCIQLAQYLCSIPCGQILPAIGPPYTWALVHFVFSQHRPK